MSMAAHSIRARAPRGDVTAPALRNDPDVLARFIEDAAHFPGGQASAVASPITEADVAEILRRSASVLPVGAQSSLTGGATPMNDVVINMARMNRIVAVHDDTVRLQAGVTLAELDAALREHGKYFPPVPTYMGAFAGGVAATNAAGAATFKYGTTRAWVAGLTVVLADGEVLDVERATVHAHVDGFFDIELAERTARVPVPR